MRKRRWALSAAAVFLAGCVVPKAQWRAANERAEDFRAQLAQANARSADLRERAEELSARQQEAEKQLAARRSIEEILEQRVENLRRETERLHGELAVAMMSSSSMPVVTASARMASGSREELELPPDLAQSFAAIARRYEGVSFDAIERVVRFESELAFAGGGDRPRPEARAALKEIAEALCRPTAKRLNVHLVGHTWGEQQVTRDLMSQHPTDWHLAAHQALAFEDCLERHGVAGVRMCVQSYGSWQPLVTGNDDVARRKNARVEIYVVPPMPLR